MLVSIVANGVSYSFHLLPSGLINPKWYVVYLGYF